MSKIVCVVPSIRREMMESFRKAWAPLFEKHKVTLITVWDGEKPCIETERFTGPPDPYDVESLRIDQSFPLLEEENRDLFCRFTDACRNLGFVAAAKLNPDYVLTLDDDVSPPVYDDNWREHISRNTPNSDYDWDWEGGSHDTIQAHLDTLSLKVPIGWMNTAHCNSEYLRGVPYGIREEVPVMLSHGVWVGVPDFDGETQLRLQDTDSLPRTLPYYVGPIPKGTLFPLCGMNVMVRKEAIPYFYFAPMGPDTKVEGLNRFSDIWMGCFLKRKFDELGWACYTGGSVVHHTRASDAKRNMEQEKLGREWNEKIWKEGTQVLPGAMVDYMEAYTDKRQRYADLITSILEQRSPPKEQK